MANEEKRELLDINTGKTGHLTFTELFNGNV